MAKFVGKIFRIPDRYLKNIRGNGAHFVHVTWYNPKNHKFRCKVITSLEEINTVPKSERGRHKGKTYAVYDDNHLAFFKYRKYSDLRNGDIQPIPVNKTKGFKVWSGYQGATELTLSEICKGKKTDLHIDK